MTGSHRSGSTWIGQILASAPRVCSIHEPFTLTTRPGIFRYRVPHWYYFVPADVPPELVRAYDAVLAFRYGYAAELRALRSARDAVRMVRDAGRFALARLMRCRPLVKDPLALLSAPWVARHYGADVIVSIRHPFAFVSSLIALRWRFRFENLIAQRELVTTLLADSADDLEAGLRAGDDAVAEAAHLWNVLHRVIARYRSEHPDWTFVRYEDLAADPLIEFEKVFARLALPFTARTRRVIVRLSGEQNRAVRVNDPRVTRVHAAAHAKQSLQRLSPEDSARVRRIVEPVACAFYSDDASLCVRR